MPLLSDTLDPSHPMHPMRRALSALAENGAFSTAAGGVRTAVRFLAVHTGLPALLVAAVLVAVGYRLLKRSARLALEVALVALVLVLASQLGWISW